MALRLKRLGFMRVRPLLGGIALWMDQKFPVEDIPELLLKDPLRS